MFLDAALLGWVLLPQPKAAGALVVGHSCGSCWVVCESDFPAPDHLRKWRTNCGDGSLVVFVADWSRVKLGLLQGIPLLRSSSTRQSCMYSVVLWGWYFFPTSEFEKLTFCDPTKDQGPHTVFGCSAVLTQNIPRRVRVCARARVHARPWHLSESAQINPDLSVSLLESALNVFGKNTRWAAVLEVNL